MLVFIIAGQNIASAFVDSILDRDPEPD